MFPNLEEEVEETVFRGCRNMKRPVRWRKCTNTKHAFASDIGSAPPPPHPPLFAQCADVRSTDAQTLFVLPIQVGLHRVRRKCTWKAQSKAMRHRSGQTQGYRRARKRRLDPKDTSPGREKGTHARTCEGGESTPAAPTVSAAHAACSARPVFSILRATRCGRARRKVSWPVKQ
jgi:hypothetical protein